MTIEDPSQSSYGYQLLPLSTSYLVGNNREFDVSDIFSGVLNVLVLRWTWHEGLISIANRVFHDKEI